MKEIKMHPSDSMTKVIAGKRYTVKTATLIADNEYWDGNNFERGGHNTFLYKTRGGAFFTVRLTQWQGERDNITPASREEAMQLWDDLPEHAVEYGQAFDAVVEEASAGRPSYFGEAMKSTNLWLPQEMIDWLKAQEGGMSETIRTLINIAMQKNNCHAA
jgi:hypothetical protein